MNDDLFSSRQPDDRVQKVFLGWMMGLERRRSHYLSLLWQSVSHHSYYYHEYIISKKDFHAHNFCSHTPHRELYAYTVGALKERTIFF